MALVENLERNSFLETAGAVEGGAVDTSGSPLTENSTKCIATESFHDSQGIASRSPLASYHSSNVGYADTPPSPWA